MDPFEPDACILLTGGLGFLGSVALEQLLRLTKVRTVYLLVRPKRGVLAAQRVERLLCGPLFHLLHQRAAAAGGGHTTFARVKVVAGDLDHPDLGLCDGDRQALLRDVSVVIHCAASLALDARIHDVLRANYVGTQHLLQLACQLPALRAFLFTSTYFTSNFLPYNTPVKEEVHYPALQLAGEAALLTHASLASKLLALPPNEADEHAAALMSRLNFVSTYAFSKVLAEQLVDEPGCLPGVAKVIVRPSLISSIAGAPYPGYVSGLAGSPGYSLAYGMGFFSSIKAVAFASDGIIDIIPCDSTAALLATAAAAAAAHGPYAGGRARVYHAASAASYPESSIGFFDKLHTFWSSNPPPLRLPFVRYPTFSGPRLPSAKGLAAGRRATAAKVWAATRLLQLTGRSRQARALAKGFEAFIVQNRPGYARSIVSRVDNVRELQRSLAPEQQAAWPILWEPGLGQSWDTYTYSGLTGLRTLLLGLPAGEVVTPVPQLFEAKPRLQDAAAMRGWMAAAGPASAGSSESLLSMGAASPDAVGIISDVGAADDGCDGSGG